MERRNVIDQEHALAYLSGLASKQRPAPAGSLDLRCAIACRDNRSGRRDRVDFEIIAVKLCPKAGRTDEVAIARRYGLKAAVANLSIDHEELNMTRTIFVVDCHQFDLCPRHYVGVLLRKWFELYRTCARDNLIAFGQLERIPCPVCPKRIGMRFEDQYLTTGHRSGNRYGRGKRIVNRNGKHQQCCNCDRAESNDDGTRTKTGKPVGQSLGQLIERRLGLSAIAVDQLHLGKHALHHQIARIEERFRRC